MASRTLWLPTPLLLLLGPIVTRVPSSTWMVTVSTLMTDAVAAGVGVRDAAAAGVGMRDMVAAGGLWCF